MSYDYKEYKTVIALYSNIEQGVAVNVVGHLSLSLGSKSPESIMGRDVIIDKSGINHRGISKYPVIVTKVKQGTLRKAINSARSCESIIMIDYPNEMLTTGHDDDLNHAISNVLEENITYLGAIFFGKSHDVDQITGKFTLWK